MSEAPRNIDKNGQPPVWTPEKRDAYLAAPLPDPTKNTCSCGEAKLLVFNHAKDRYAEAYFCPLCDGDLG